MYKFSRTRRGFTLIEILVVIAIISVLLTIVYASASQARKKARDDERIAELEQIAAALQVWATAHGRYPSAFDGNCDYNNSFAAGGCMQVLVRDGLFTALPSDPTSGKLYYYNTWCRIPVTPADEDQHYRLWTDGEINHGSLAGNWWNNNTIGKTTCTDPS